MSIRTVLADDHQIFLVGLRALLDKLSDIEVVGEATDGEQALLLSRDLTPDVVVMDITMPVLGGIEATRQIAQELPSVRVLCLSMHKAKRYVRSVFEAGAAGYLPKDCALDELPGAIRTVSANQVYVSPVIATKFVDELRGHDPKPCPSVGVWELSSRECQVLRFIADGLTTREIAEKLNLSVKTIGTHREHLMQKLNIHSISGLTKYAIRKGLTTVED